MYNNRNLYLCECAREVGDDATRVILSKLAGQLGADGPDKPIKVEKCYITLISIQNSKVSEQQSFALVNAGSRRVIANFLKCVTRIPVSKLRTKRLQL